jgi:DNA-binding MarR family transcriptional regulator
MSTRNQQLLQFIQQLRVLYRELYKARPNEAVTRSQMELLAIVGERQDGLTTKELAARLQVTSGAITQLVDTLVGKGLLGRIENPHDRRSALVVSKKAFAGEDCISFEAFYTAHVSSMFKDLSDVEVEQLTMLIRKITPPKESNEP